MKISRILAAVILPFLPPLVRALDYGNPDLAGWQASYAGGRIGETEEQVVAHLEKDDGIAADCAALAWCEIQRTKGLDVAEAARQLPEGSRARINLGTLPEIFQLHLDGQSGLLLKKFPPSGDLSDFSYSSLAYLAIESEAMHDMTSNLKLSLEMVRRDPANFKGFWNLIDATSSETAKRKAILEGLEGDGEGLTFVRTLYEKHFPDARPMSRACCIALANEWIGKYPSDAWAHLFLSIQYSEAQDWETALKHATEMLGSWPFGSFSGGTTGYTLLLVRNRKFDELDAYVSFLMNMRTGAGSPEETENEALRIKANSCRRAGEIGKAWELMGSHKESARDKPAFAEEAVRCALAARRFKQAIEWSRALHKDFPSSATLGLHLKCLNDGSESTLAAEIIRNPATVWEGADDQAYYEGYRTFDSLAEHGEKAAILGKSVGAFPESFWLRFLYAGSLADAGKTDDALREFAEAAKISTDFVWGMSRYGDLLAKTGEERGDPGLASGIFRDLASREPWSETIWNELARAAGNEGETNVWKEAREASPGSLFTVKAEIEKRVAEEDWQSVSTLLESVSEKAATPDEQIELRLYTAWRVLKMTSVGVAKRPDVEQALKELDQYRDLGGNLGNYHRYRVQFLEMLGNKEEAGKELEGMLFADPDDDTPIQWLFSGPTGRQLGTRRFTHLQTYLNRNPYDGPRYSNVIEYHAKWGGSPVIAIATAERLKQIDPEEYQKSRSRIGIAYQNLGDSARNYQLTYTGGSGPGTSARYIGWWDASRRKAQAGSADVELINNTTARIRRSDGTIELREFHPQFGKFTKLQVGDAWVEAKYDGNGNLTRLDTSGKEFIDLSYDDQEHISRMENSDGTVLEFEYNDADKPRLIHLLGTGKLVITYDESNEVDTVEPEGVDGEEAGPAMAMKLTQAFQKLLGIVNTFESGDLAGIRSLVSEDQTNLQLEEKHEQAMEKFHDTEDEDEAHAKAFAGLVASGFELASHKQSNSAGNNTYGTEAIRLLESMFEAMSPGMTMDKDTANLLVRGASLWHELQAKLKPDGVQSSDLRTWQSMVETLQSMASAADGKIMADLFSKASSHPLELLPPERWLPASYLENPGFWRRYPLSDVVPVSLGDPVFHCGLVRRNGDRLVGSSKGLSVMRKGFWEHLGFDETDRKLHHTPSGGTLKASSEILSMAEDANGKLWLGTANGVILVDDAYTGTKWVRTGDGDSGSVQVNPIVPFADRMILAGADGISTWHIADDGSPAMLATAPGDLGKGNAIRWMIPAAEGIVAGLDKGAFYWIPGSDIPPLLLSNHNFKSATWADGKLYLMENDTLFVSSFIDGKGFGECDRAMGQEGMVKTNVIHGLTTAENDEGESIPAILTDQGISFHHNFHIEHLKLPWTDRITGVKSANWLGRQAVVVASDGIYLIKRDQVSHVGFRATQMVTHPETGDVWAAGNNGGLRRIFRKDRGSIEMESLYVSASALALSPEGDPICNNGTDIVRIVKNADGDFEPEILFNIETVRREQNLPMLGGDSIRDGNDVYSILADKKGNVWVVTTRVLFRHHKDGVQTFAFDRDPETFPARSDWLHNIFEDVDGDVWLVASNEGHRSFRSISLTGGLLRWTGDRFERSATEQLTSYTFVNGYTEISPGTAIAAGNTGFCLHEKGRWNSFYKDLKDPSYIALNQKHPQTWMGTKGTRIGEDTWLFGCAAGIIGYKAGQWFYPEDLNWMLPDQQLAEYGARSVHAIAASPQGFVCASTDRGTLLYDTGGASEVSFLVHNNSSQLAVQGFNQKLAKAEADLVLDNLAKESKEAKLVEQLKQTQEKIEAIQSGMRGVSLKEIDKEQPAENAGEIEREIRHAQLSGNREKVDAELVRLERVNRALLVRLERDNYSLFQALTMNPLDLASNSVRQKLLKPGEKLVQFIPDKDKLFIHLVSRDRLTIREVAIGEKELEEVAIRVSKALAAEANKPRGVKLNEVSPAGPAGDGALLRDLAWLYDQLIRPVESDLDQTKRVYIVPSGALTYVPFAALVSSTEGSKPVYAVEKYNLGCLTSMFHLDLVLRDEPSVNVDTLVFGDPDGSLPGARKEAEIVHTKSGSSLPILLGEEATREGMVGQLANACTVHFATHAVLDPENTGESFLLCTGGIRLTLVDAMALDMSEVDLVVLSACETGIGSRGREYATLARSFAHAGAPTVVATLWPVSDWPSQEVMSQFYENVSTGMDRFTSLSDSQRKMAARNDRLSHPALWAGYVTFGKP